MDGIAMKQDLSGQVLPAARERGLGELISLHRRERPLIRVRATFTWLLLGGLLMGVPIASALGRSAIAVAAGLFAAHLGLLAVAGPLAARLFPPEGPPRWVALFDHGLIDVTGSGADALVRVLRFDQIRHIEQDRGYASSDGRRFTAKSAVARLVADLDGVQTVLDFHGFRHQDRFVDELRSRVAGGPSRSAKAAVGRGSVSHGGLLITKRGLSAPDGAGLVHGENPILAWADVGQVNERDDGTLSIYRRSHTAGLTLWFSAVIPDTSAAAAMIVHQRNRAQD